MWTVEDDPVPYESGVQAVLGVAKGWSARFPGCILRDARGSDLKGATEIDRSIVAEHILELP
jgi:hypothetical protein